MNVQSLARLPARGITGAGRSMVLLIVVCYLVDTVAGWSVFSFLWLSLGLMSLGSLGMALIPIRPRIELSVRPRRVVAGDSAAVLLRARAGRSPFRLPGPLVEVGIGKTRRMVRLPTLVRGRVVENQVQLDDLRRGVVPVGPVIARRSDPLGLVRWTEQWSEARELLVFPRMVGVGALRGGIIRDPSGVPSDEVSMNDLSFHALREYVPGDELRHVHWRSSAKAGALQVRQYHDTRRTQLAIVLDTSVDSYPDPEDFELAVSTAASIAARADADRAGLSLLCGPVALTDRSLDVLLDAFCRVQLGKADPRRSVREAVHLAPETSWLVVCTGAAAPPDLTHVIRAQSAGGMFALRVSADASAPTSLGAPHAGVYSLTLRSLEELPAALAATAPRTHA